MKRFEEVLQLKKVPQSEYYNVLRYCLPKGLESDFVTLKLIAYNIPWEDTIEYTSTGPKRKLGGKSLFIQKFEAINVRSTKMNKLSKLRNRGIEDIRSYNDLFLTYASETLLSDTDSLLLHMYEESLSTPVKHYLEIYKTSKSTIDNKFQFYRLTDMMEVTKEAINMASLARHSSSSSSSSSSSHPSSSSSRGRFTFKSRGRAR